MKNLILIIAVITAFTFTSCKDDAAAKVSKEKVKPLSRDFDGKGFDQDGVSKPKVVGANPARDDTAVKSHLVEDGAAFHSDEPMPKDVPLAAFEEKQQEQGLNFGALLNDTEEVINLQTK